MASKLSSRMLSSAVLSMGLIVGTAGAYADDEHTWDEGQVIVVSSIRTRPGMFEEYMKYVDGTYKKYMDEEKKAGNIVSFSVYQAFPRSPHDPDIYLTTVYKNWAAFDGLRDREEAVEKKIWGSTDASTKASVDREKLREVLGDQVIQEMKLR